MHNLKIIITSTRPGRKGPSIATWLNEVAKNHPEFNVEVLDLAEINLPFFDEQFHPMRRTYEHQHTKDWSKKIDEADAFIIVTPEYNYSFTAAFKNAIDYLYFEWKYKPVGIASYGGVSGGIRAAQMMKQVLTTLNMTPLTEAIPIPFFTKFIDEAGVFTPNEELSKAADTMFKSLEKWAGVLKQMR